MRAGDGGSPLRICSIHQLAGQPRGPPSRLSRPTHPQPLRLGPLRRPTAVSRQPECSRWSAPAQLAPPLAAPAAAAPPLGGTPLPRAAAPSAAPCAWLPRPRPRRCWSARPTGRACSPLILMPAPSAAPSTPPAATPASPATTPTRCRCVGFVGMAAAAGRQEWQPLVLFANRRSTKRSVALAGCGAALQYLCRGSRRS